MVLFRRKGKNMERRIRELESRIYKVVSWRPINTAPKTGRQKIWLKTPYSPDGVLAYSNTWWTAGFSVECKPTHWKPASAF